MARTAQGVAPLGKEFGMESTHRFLFLFNQHFALLFQKPLLFDKLTCAKINPVYISVVKD
jgi:hypothetical protein